jgi:two-component system, sensor histidine kinase and response regulator
VPVLALTANALQGDESRCLAAGMDGFLPKPLTLDHLAAKLGRWLPVAQASSQRVGDTSLNAALPGAINMRHIATLREIGARAGTNLVGEMLRTFLEVSVEQLARVENAIQSGDCRQLSRCAHSLKSSTAYLGAEELSALYRRLEALGRDNRIDEARPLLDALRNAHEDVARRAHEIMEETA